MRPQRALNYKPACAKTILDQKQEMNIPNAILNSKPQ